MRFLDMAESVILGKTRIDDRQAGHCLVEFDQVFGVDRDRDRKILRKCGLRRLIRGDHRQREQDCHGKQYSRARWRAPANACCFHSNCQTDRGLVKLKLINFINNQ